jgi:hypothetical protein
MKNIRKKIGKGCFFIDEAHIFASISALFNHFWLDLMKRVLPERMGYGLSAFVVQNVQQARLIFFFTKTKSVGTYEKSLSRKIG